MVEKKKQNLRLDFASRVSLRNHKKGQSKALLYKMFISEKNSYQNLTYMYIV